MTTHALMELADNCFGIFRFVRKLRGGKWAFVWVGYPIYQDMWLRLPDDATPNYMEPLWEGIITFEDYTK